MKMVANAVTKKCRVLIIKQEIYFTVKLQLIYLFLNIIHHMMFLKVTLDYFCKHYVLYRKAKKKLYKCYIKKKRNTIYFELLD